MKRWALLLSVLFFLALTTSVWAQFTFTTNNGGITITGYSGTNGSVDIPSFTNGFPVVEIDSPAFVNHRELTNVTIPSSITVIGGQAFDDCGITSLTIPDSVTSIGYEAFAACIALDTVTIPAGVTNMGGGVFAYCDSLTNLSVNATNPAFASVGGVLFNKAFTTLVQYPPRASTNVYIIPAGVTNLAFESFRSSLNLSSVTMPDGLISIESATFEDCLELTNAAIPDGVVDVEGDAFYHCSLPNAAIPASVTYLGPGIYEENFLTNISVDVHNTNYTSRDGVVFSKDMTTVIECPNGKSGFYVIPDGVTHIGWNAFSGCSSITGVTIPNTVTNIDWESFEFSGLTSVTIPSSVNYIGGDAFTGCYNLKQIYFEGNAPTLEYPLYVFVSDPGTVYYLPGTVGWPNTFGGLPTALWYQSNPVILGNGYGLGVNTNGFGFTVSWATNLSVVVEVCTNLVNPNWQPLQTNTLINGTAQFGDPLWTNSPARFYRLRSLQ